MAKSNGIAVFDLDGTITAKDTFLEFLKYTAGASGLWRCMLLNLPFIMLYYLKVYPNHKLKERFFSFFFKGESADSVREKGDAFGRDILPLICHQSAMAIIGLHKKHGHDVYILTASSDLWLSMWCADNNLHLLSTAFEVKDGLMTGKIKGQNCYGREKCIHIKPVLEKGQYNLSYGYGDSASDKYFLSLMRQSFLMELTEKNAKRVIKELSF